MDILVDVLGQKLKISNNLKSLISGTQEFVRFKFNLSSDWDGLTTFAQFTQGGKSYNQILDSENCAYLPAEIKKGLCTICLYGNADDVIAVTDYQELVISDNIIVKDADSTEITKTLYNQLTDKVKEVREVDIANLENKTDVLETKINSKASQAQVDMLENKMNDLSKDEVVSQKIDAAVNTKLTQQITDEKVNETIEEKIGSIITTDKIADDAVTTDKLLDNSVTTDKIAVGSIITTSLADKSVTSGKLSDDLNTEINKIDGLEQEINNVLTIDDKQSYSTLKVAINTIAQNFVNIAQKSRFDIEMEVEDYSYLVYLKDNPNSLTIGDVYYTLKSCVIGGTTFPAKQFYIWNGVGWSELPIVKKISATTAGVVDAVFDKQSDNAQCGKGIYNYLTSPTAITEIFQDAVRSVCRDNPIGENNPFPVPSSEIYQALNNKIDKVDGKVLSTNDYTTDEKTKLSGIEAQANKTVTDQSYNKASANPQSGKAISDYLNSSDCSSHFATLLCSGNPIESNNEFPVTSGVIYTALLNKQNVPNRVTVSGETLTVSDNAEYYGENITALTVTYPTGNFECWLNLSFAKTGTITVNLPSSKYIGDIPQFSNGETWELSIKNGVVIAQKAEDGNE